MSRSPDSNGNRVTPFLTKTYQLVDDHSSDEVISWNADGSSFVIWQPAEFARDVLPLFFKHNNLSSFVRQLNTYGFRKISDRWEFINENFKRGEKRLINDIRRRKKSSPPPAAVFTDADGVSANSSEEPATSRGEPLSPPPVQSATSVTGTITSDVSANMEDENNRLRQENKRLFQELGRMKNVCSNIFSLVSDLNSARNKVDGGSRSVSPLQLLDLMPHDGLPQQLRLQKLISQHDDSGEGSNTRLFGFPIESNRFSDGVFGDDMNLYMNSGTRMPYLDPSESHTINGASPVASSRPSQ